MDCCGAFFTGEPVSVLAAGREDGPLTNVFLDFGEGRAVQITRYQVPGGRGQVRLRIVAERGTASAELPGRVRWADGDGRHLQSLPVERPVVQVLLEQFYRVVREGQPPEPALDQAYRLLGWVRATRQSRAEGRRIEVGKSQFANCKAKI
jgi:predicted dehydrogenase